jgi:FlaA1/EpsC-like NDP-sugar epimerase
MKTIKNIKIRPSQFVLIGDQVLILMGLLSALFANYRLLSVTIFPLHTIFYRSLLHVGLGIAAWVMFSVYRKVIRYFNSKDYLNLIFILFVLHCFSFATGVFFPVKHQLKPEIFVISFFITSGYIIGSRFIISYLYFFYNRSSRLVDSKKLLIYGAGELGVFLKKSIMNRFNREYHVVAFLDDDKKKIGRFIGGIKVVDAYRDLKEVIEHNQVTDVIIANNALTPERKSQFLRDILPFNLRLREITSVRSLLQSNFKFEQLSSIEISDLMSRKPIELYDEHVVTALQEKTVLVTGAAGSIGSEIVRKLSEHLAAQIICVDFSESALYDLEQELRRKHPNQSYRFILTDIRQEHMLKRIFEEHQPHFVYHAAAYKHVPLMELYPWEAARTNVKGTDTLVRLSIEHEVERFVFISSDKAVNPTSVMGATKRLAEMIVQAYAAQSNHSTCFVVTRFGNVLGSNGSVVPLFKKQIQSGGPVTVTHPEMIRYFMTIAEACQLVLEASVMAEGGEVFVFDMGEPVKIVDLARNMIRLSGLIPDVDIHIQFVGQRPGEKLYEEVFAPNEKMKETHHEKIMISTENQVAFSMAQHILESLDMLEGKYDPNGYRELIKVLLPEYQSVSLNHSQSNLKTDKPIRQF